LGPSSSRSTHETGRSPQFFWVFDPPTHTTQTAFGFF
jgi:hypothetical protein